MRRFCFNRQSMTSLHARMDGFYLKYVQLPNQLSWFRWARTGIFHWLLIHERILQTLQKSHHLSSIKRGRPLDWFGPKEITIFCYFKNNKSPLVLQKIQNINLRVAVLTSETSIKDYVLVVNKASSVVGNLADGIACGVNMLPFNPFFCLGTLILNNWKVQTPQRGKWSFFQVTASLNVQAKSLFYSSLTTRERLRLLWRMRG